MKFKPLQFVGIFVLAAVGKDFTLHVHCYQKSYQSSQDCKLPGARNDLTWCKRKEADVITRNPKKGIVLQNIRIIFLIEGIISMLQSVPRKFQEK